MKEEAKEWKSERHDLNELVTSDGDGISALIELADHYSMRLVRIINRAEAKNKTVKAAVLRYYTDAIENVRRLANVK